VYTFLDKKNHGFWMALKISTATGTV